MTVEKRPPTPATAGLPLGRESGCRDGIPRLMEPRPVSHSHSVLVHWLGPPDANSAGFGPGVVGMRLRDPVPGVAGVHHSGGRVVTAGMGRMTFNEPIEIGELLTLRAS